MHGGCSLPKAVVCPFLSCCDVRIRDLNDDCSDWDFWSHLESLNQVLIDGHHWRMRNEADKGKGKGKGADGGGKAIAGKEPVGGGKGGAGKEPVEPETEDDHEFQNAPPVMPTRAKAHSLATQLAPGAKGKGGKGKGKNFNKGKGFFKGFDKGAYWGKGYGKAKDAGKEGRLQIVEAAGYYPWGKGWGYEPYAVYDYGWGDASAWADEGWPYAHQDGSVCDGYWGDGSAGW